MINKKRRSVFEKYMGKRTIAMMLSVVMLISMLPMHVFAVEDSGHQHTELCYVQPGALLCDKQESEGHLHEESCYCPSGEYICDLVESEGHTHDDSCYLEADEYEVASDSEAQEKQLICELEETEGHLHNDECICPGGELVCELEEAERHAHSEACYAKGNELICTYEETDDEQKAVSSDSQSEAGQAFIAAVALIDSTAVKEAAQNYFDAIEADMPDTNNLHAVLDGYMTAIMSAMDAYDELTEEDKACEEVSEAYRDLSELFEEMQRILDPLPALTEYAEDTVAVIGETEYSSLQVAVDSVTSGQTIKLVKDFSISDYIDVKRAVDFTLDMDGKTITLEDGVYYGFEFYKMDGPANIVITGNGTIDATNSNGGYCLDPYDEGLTLTIKNGTYKSDIGCGICCSYATVVIEGGSFESDSYYAADFDEANVTIKGGNFYSGSYSALNAYDTNSFLIEGGTFTNGASDCATFYVGSWNLDTVVSVKNAKFVNTSGYKAIEYDNNNGHVSSVVATEDYHAEPADWETTNPSQVEFKPKIITVTFNVERTVWKQMEATPDEFIFPENPVHSQSYDFLYWENEIGERIDDVDELKVGIPINLYAVFSDRTHTVSFYDKGTVTTQQVMVTTPLNEVVGVDRVDTGDGFCGWKLGNEFVNKDTTTPIYSDLTLTAVYDGSVMNYDELISALENKQEEIILGADIEVEGEIVVDYDCVIDGNNFDLIRPENYKGILLSVKNTATTLTVKNASIDGSNIDASSSAVYVYEGTTLVMNDVIVKNNKITAGWGDGGGIYLEADTDLVLTGCTIQNNYAKGNGGGICYDGQSQVENSNTITLINCDITGNTAASYQGGGVYINADDIVNITGCLIDGNTAERFGGGLFCNGSKSSKVECVNITDSKISNNTAMYGGGIDHTGVTVHLYGTTSVEYNQAESGGATNSWNGGNEETAIYMHDNSTICYNEASGDGGAIYLWEQLLVMYDNSSIHHNKAGGDGGAVYARDYGIRQYGGVIRDNYAAEFGGGVYCLYDENLFESGMIFDNLAGLAGDDIYQAWREWEGLYAAQPNRIYGEGDSLRLGTVKIEPIADYYEVPLDGISVPYYGWFIDGIVSETWDPDNRKYVYDIQERYISERESTIVSEANGNLDYLQGTLENTGVKAIWYGLLLAYDVNYESSTEHQYDTQTYSPNANATVLSNMFIRPGYVFTGWNTERNGAGTAYSPGELIKMDKSQVLYAQWEKVPVGSLTISKTISGTAASATQDFVFTVILDDESISGTYGDLEFVNGVATFTLKAGESATASMIPAGVGYTITESDNDGYTVTVNGVEGATTSGNIVADETTVVVFNNHKESGSGETPGKPDEPTTPSEPDKPTTPSEPDKPTTPSEPDEPTTPTDPDKPTTPSEPDKPTTPSEPDEPTTPSEPDEPTTPNEPNEPAAPALPDNAYDDVPKTGDTSHTALWFALMCISVVGVIITSRKLRYKGMYSKK